MNCGEYLLLTPKERTEFIGKIGHACMSDSDLFAMGQLLIRKAERKGLFEGVVIAPASIETENNIEPPLNELT